MPSADAVDARLLVTGGSGFIGTNLVEHYRARGSTVVNVDPAPPRNPAHRDVWTRFDPLDGEALRAAIAELRPTAVLHMGARTDLDGADLAAYAANTEGVRVMVDALRDAPSVQRVIFASSRMVCHIAYRPKHETDWCPPNPYGESKVVGEQIVRAADLPVPWTLVRPTSIWGEWFDVPYKTFFLQVAAGRYVNVRGHVVDKSFGYVGNTVHEIDRMLHAPAEQVHRRTLYLADYPPINVAEMAERIRAELGARPIRTLPLAALKPPALVGDALRKLGWRNPPLTSFRLANLITEMVFDLDATQAIAGELPYTMEEGVRRTVKWMREAGEV
jgi:nucleoside-diphosphate-sugar epimerase